MHTGMCDQQGSSSQTLTSLWLGVSTPSSSGNSSTVNNRSTLRDGGRGTSFVSDTQSATSDQQSTDSDSDSELGATGSSVESQVAEARYQHELPPRKKVQTAEAMFQGLVEIMVSYASS